MIAESIGQSEAVLTPGEFCRLLLKALDASEGRSKRRKRDQTPDQIGMAIKRDLLQSAVVDNPRPEQFGAWLLGRSLAELASGPVQAMCSSILDDYQLAVRDSAFRTWLEAGAPSEDAAHDEAGPAELGRKQRPRHA
jgi:hypothetical protein